MLLSVNYHSPHLESAGEIKCPTNQLGLVFDFVKNHPEKRYNLILKDNNYKQLDLIRDITENFTIECDTMSKLSSILPLGFPAYLTYSATDWETFSELKALGVSDIRIDGPLAFQMDKINLAKESTKIRLSPTLSPNSSLTPKAPNDFFIRPEDVSLYTAVDILDFNESNQERENALFSIYSRGSFSYNLSNLIPDLHYDINNLFFSKDFAEARLNCGQRCKEPGKSCHICSNYFALLRNSIDLVKKS